MSINLLKSQINEARSYCFSEMQEAHWANLKNIFTRINIMHSDTKLVGNSKVMHHLLPNMIPPIDREYTLQFLFGNKNIKNGSELEWGLMREIISRFFIPIISDQGFSIKADNWMSNRNDYQWYTSILKV